MALSGADRAILETNLGRLDADELEDVEQRIARLGSAHAAALELLTIERAELDRSADTVRSENAAATITRQRERVDAAIDRLVSYLTTSPDVTLSPAAEALLGTATESTPTTSSIDITSTNRRAGG